jgi:hypothetical protein
MVARRPACILIALCATACGGGGSLVLTADTYTTVADGQSVVHLTAEASFRGSAASGQVTFTTTLGSFDENEAERVGDASLQDGRADIEFFPGLTPGTATISATWANPNGKRVEALPIDVTIEAPPPADRFEFSCEHRVLGVDYQVAEPAATQCLLRATLRDGQPVVNPQVAFMTEAGSIDPNPVERRADGTLVFRYRAAGEWPADVDPLGTVEPFRAADGLTRNPRDGLVTIVALVRGAERFTDANGNGRFDDGEAFEDAGEPFVDCDDNGDWDSGLPCEADGLRYRDLNDNGVPDEANGRWDDDTQIWRAFKVLWSRPPLEGLDTTRIEDAIARAPSIDIRNGGRQTFHVFLLDDNMNPIAATDRSDNLQVAVSGATDDFGRSRMLPGGLGMRVESGPNGDGRVTAIADLDSVGSCAEPGNRCFRVNLDDPRPDRTEDPPRRVDLTATVRHTPIPGGEPLTFQLSVSGTSQ